MKHEKSMNSGYFSNSEERRKYFESFLQTGKHPKKQVTVYLDDEKIEHIDMVARVFSSISGSKSISRNSFIEEAVNKFVADAIEYLQETEGIDVEVLIEEAHQEQEGLSSFPNQERGMEQTM